MFLYLQFSLLGASNFARFALPVVPHALLARERLIPKNQWVLWIFGIVSSILAAGSPIGIRRVIPLLYH